MNFSIVPVGKSRLTGVSKTSGKNYDLVCLHYLDNDPKVVGQACKTVLIGSNVLDFDSIKLGQKYTLSFDFGSKFIKSAILEENQIKRNL